MTPEIDQAAAEVMLKDYIKPDGGLFDCGHYLSWTPGDEEIVLDDRFTADELEAIVYWMRHGHTRRENMRCYFCKVPWTNDHRWRRKRSAHRVGGNPGGDGAVTRTEALILSTSQTLELTAKNWQAMRDLAYSLEDENVALRAALREAVDTLERAGARDTARHCAKALEGK